MPGMTTSTITRKKNIGQPGNGGEFANKAHSDANVALTFEEPTFRVTDDYYRATIGSKYFGFRDVTAIAKDVRADLKAATAAGHLRAGVTYSVTVDKFAGGQSLDVSIRGLSDKEIFDDEAHQLFGKQHREDINEFVNRVKSILGAYNRDASDSSTDYFNTMFYSSVSVETERDAIWRRYNTLRTSTRRDLANARERDASEEEIEAISEPYWAAKCEYDAMIEWELAQAAGKRTILR